MSANAQSGKAQYTEQAGEAPTLTQKLTDVRAFLKKRNGVMLVTHAPNGDLHSRCMVPAEITPDWKFRFIYDRDSYWDKEIENEWVGSICEADISDDMTACTSTSMRTGWTRTTDGSRSLGKLRVWSSCRPC